MFFSFPHPSSPGNSGVDEGGFCFDLRVVLEDLGALEAGLDFLERFVRLGART